MARLARLSVVNEAHYVRLKGIDEISLIPSLNDIDYLIRILELTNRSGKVEIAGYALMPDQFDFLIVPRGNPRNLSAGMQVIARLYCQYFNNAYGRRRSDTIWRGRFNSCVIGGNDNVLAALMALESEPERKNLGSADVFPWSSYHHHTGKRNDGFMVSSPAYWNLGNTPFERQKKYSELFEGGVDPEFYKHLQKCILRGWPVGDEKFLSSIDAPPERIRPLRGRGRPPKNRVPNK